MLNQMKPFAFTARTAARRFAAIAVLLAAATSASAQAPAMPATPPASPVPAAPATKPSSPPDVPTPAQAAAPQGTAAAAAPSGPVAPVGSLDDKVQEAKADVIRLNRDLLVLEEELLFPANTQVAVFVSMDVGKLFMLDSVKIKLNDKDVANYLYTPNEVQALHRGGVQRLYVGNLKSGTHEIVAFFTGKGPHDRDYRRGATVKFDKGTEPKYIELQIKDSTGKLQPEFEVKIWQ